jgi:uncharacterized damage-inducible protein DinB
MAGSDPKEDLTRYLQEARDAVLWKLDGLAEYDVRRPLVPTGTNLLGLVKHLTAVEFGYFRVTFGRPPGQPFPWEEVDGEDPNVDMWATPDESRDELTARYRQAWAAADETISQLPLDAAGQVPWWSADHREVTLHKILVHVIAETSRHAGHADLVRELIDGAAGIMPGRSNLPPGDRAWWDTYRGRVEQAAQEAARRAGAADSAGS